MTHFLCHIKKRASRGRFKPRKCRQTAAHNILPRSLRLMYIFTSCEKPENISRKYKASQGEKASEATDKSIQMYVNSKGGCV